MDDDDHFNVGTSLCPEIRAIPRAHAIALAKLQNERTVFCVNITDNRAIALARSSRISCFVGPR